MKKRQEGKLEVAELRTLRFAMEVKSLDKTKNERIRRTAHVRRLGKK